jgi:hypothetical protein
MFEGMWHEEDRGYVSPCHAWDGMISSEGYARFGGESVARLVCEPPPGQQVDHLCGQRDCVRADHLEAVTQIENIRRAARLDAATVQAIRAATGTHKEIAERFGLTRRYVGQIRARRVWR